MSFIMLLIIGYSLVLTTNIVKILISVSFTLNLLWHNPLPSHPQQLPLKHNSLQTAAINKKAALSKGRLDHIRAICLEHSLHLIVNILSSESKLLVKHFVRS